MISRKLLILGLSGPLIAALFTVSSIFFNNDVTILGLERIPSHWLHKTGAFTLWLFTVKLFPILKQMGLVEFEDCFAQDPSGTVKVIVAAQKGGALYSGFFARSISEHCGISVGIGTPLDDNWTSAPDVPPDHEVDFLMAIAQSNRWEEYLEKPFSKNKKLQCVVMTRNPFDRFISLYKYTRDGGESGLQGYSREMKKIKNVEDRVKFAWKAFGKVVMRNSHSILTKSLDRKCIQVRVDDLFFKSSEKYDEIVRIILKTYEVKDEVVPSLLKELQSLDINRLTPEEKTANHHISGRSLEAGEKEDVANFIRKDSEISNFLLKQCQELNYLDCE